MNNIIEEKGGKNTWLGLPDFEITKQGHHIE